jgi:hypothetical protein
MTASTRSPRRAPTQNERVACAGMAAERRGIDQSQFLAPNVKDGRGQITRLASRIADLRAAGYRIQTKGRRHGFRVYVFEAAPPTSPSPDLPALDPELFERPVGAAPPLSPYDPRAEA